MFNYYSVLKLNTYYLHTKLKLVKEILQVPNLVTAEK